MIRQVTSFAADFGAAVTAAVAEETGSGAPAASAAAGGTAEPTLQRNGGMEALEREVAAELRALGSAAQVPPVFVSNLLQNAC